MTDERPHGWESVPHADDLRGERPEPSMTASAPAGASPYARYHSVPRRTRRLTRRGLVGVIAGGTAVVLLLVAGVIGYSVGSAAHSPTHQVDAFLDAVESGHVARALDEAGVDPGEDDVLLTTAAYAKAKSTVTAHRIERVDTSGDGATVHVMLRQGGHAVPATFQLSKHGTDLGVFPKWRLDPVTLGTLRVAVRGPAGTPLTVAGRTVSTSREGTASLRVLPGTYDVGVDGGGWYSADATTVTVSGFGSVASDRPGELATELTAKGTAAAQAAVNAWVDHCIASTSIRPSGCSFYAYGEDPSSTYSNERWTLDSRPGFGLSDWSTKGWVVRTTTPGSATFTADFTGPTGSGVGEAGPIDVYADGYISGFTSAGATFVPAVTEDGTGESGS